MMMISGWSRTALDEVEDSAAEAASFSDWRDGAGAGRGGAGRAWVWATSPTVLVGRGMPGRSWDHAAGLAWSSVASNIAEDPPQPQTPAR